VSRNTVYFGLRITIASAIGLGLGGLLPSGPLALNFDILRLTTLGLTRFSRGGSRSSPISSNSRESKGGSVPVELAGTVVSPAE
jgi:hypothetical protein